MKLHLNTSLRMALLACLIAGAQVLAETVNKTADSYGNFHLEAATTYTLINPNSTMHVLVKSDENGTGATIEVAEGVTQTVKSVSQNGNTTSNSWGYTKSGDGTLVVAEAPITDGGRKGEYYINITGGTLQFLAENALGVNGSATDAGLVSIQGSSADKVATLQLDGNQQLNSAISLNGNAVLKGAGVITSNGALTSGNVIKATGTNNVIMSTLKTGWDFNFDVEGVNDELTLVGQLVIGDSLYFQKRGQGTLIIDEKATVDDEFYINLNVGTLRVENEMTVAKLDFTTGTTLEIGKTFTAKELANVGKTTIVINSLTDLEQVDGTRDDNGFVNTTYTLVKADSLTGETTPNAVGSGGVLAGNAITTNSENDLTVQGQTYLVQESTVTYDAIKATEGYDAAQMTKVVVSNGANVDFSTDGTFNGNIVVSGKGVTANSEAKNGALTVEAGKTADINGTLTVQGGDTTIYSWGNDINGKAGASLTVDAIVLNSNLAVNDSIQYSRGDVTVEKDVTGTGNFTLGAGGMTIGGDIDTTGAVSVTSSYGSLTVNGDVSSKSFALSGGADATVSTLSTTDGTTVKGTGSTLSFADENSSVSGALAVSDNGVLDLSDVTTFNVEGLNLGAGTTIILGQDTHINFTGALTIGEGVIFDVSGWCSYTEFHPYDLFTYMGDGTFDASGITNAFVTIHTKDGDNTKAYLTVSGDNVRLVPEPATATLSLLALAGLATRRRRK